MKNKNWWKNVFSVNHETPVVHKNTCSIKHLLRDIVLGDKSTHTKITSPYVNKYLNLEMHVYKKYILYKSSKKNCTRMYMYFGKEQIVSIKEWQPNCEIV